MIPQAAITAWRNIAPWASPDQVEHDLILSRAICALYAHPVISENLVFRGGTALHKLFFSKAGRFSEDLDFVQTRAEPIKKTVDAIRDCLDGWLGNPSWKQNQGRFTLNYRFTTEIEPIITRKVKIEINTREHINVQPHITIPYKINNSWFQGQSDVITYSIEELLGTKLRALFQRKKGRDLYDFWYVMQYQKELDGLTIISIFEKYLHNENRVVSRAEFEKNLALKQQSLVFNEDIKPLLSAEQVNTYVVQDAYQLLFEKFLPKLQGEPWKGFDVT